METAEPKKSGEPDEWQVKDWCRTLMDAEAIKGDPKKMAACRPHLKTMHKGIKSLADLKDVAKEKMEVESGEEDA